jgi:hypothetical protein
MFMQLEWCMVGVFAICRPSPDFIRVKEQFGHQGAAAAELSSLSLFMTASHLVEIAARPRRWVHWTAVLFIWRNL